MEKYFTHQRLSSYTDLTDYIENIKICQRYYPILNIFEIVLRNRINDFFIKTFGAAWLKKILKKQFSFDPGTEIENKVRSAETILTRENKFITHDALLSNLTLGFWVALLSNEKDQFFHRLNRYDKRMSSKYNKTFMREVFKLNSNDSGSDTKIKEVRDELDSIRKFRNRVFHYEKVSHLELDIKLIIEKYIIIFQNETEDLNTFLQNF